MEQLDLAYPIVYLFARSEGPGVPVQIDFTSDTHGLLAYFGGDRAAIYTGATYGVTDIHFERLDESPGDAGLDGWETVEEASIDVTSEMVLLPHPAASIQSLDQLDATQVALPHLAPGTYMLRVSARGRDVHRSNVAVQLQFWPTSVRAGLRVLAVGDTFDPRTLTSVTPRHHVQDPVSTTHTDSGRVDVSYHTFLISGRDVDPTDTYTNGSVFDAGNNLISVHTGIASGPVDVVVERFDGDPLLETGTPQVDASEWDSIDEVTIPVRTDMWFITLDGEIVDSFGAFTATTSSGTRCFRICVKGRASNWDMIVDEPTERYLIQTWPSHGPSMISPVKWTDGIWEV